MWNSAFIFICLSHSTHDVLFENSYIWLNVSSVHNIRYEMLQDNVEGYRKEIASLREKDQKMATAAQKYEQTIHTLSEDLRAAKEKFTMAEVFFFFFFYLVLFY